MMPIFAGVRIVKSNLVSPVYKSKAKYVKRRRSLLERLSWRPWIGEIYTCHIEKKLSHYSKLYIAHERTLLVHPSKYDELVADLGRLEVDYANRL